MSVKALAKKGGIFVAGNTVIVKSANVVVVKSGRVPTILMLYVPAGLDKATVIYPEEGLIEISLVAKSRAAPSDVSIPV
jgi:hypothetical protein